MTRYPLWDQPKLVVVRHGETGWSKDGRHTGRTDVPLLESGRSQARSLASRLAGRTFSLVLTSPLQRASLTCQLAGFGTRAEEADDLVEWDYGEYEGRTTEEIRQQRPGWTLFGDGVPGGESANDVGRRADRIVERVRAQAGDVLCFAHGHVLRVLAARWIGLPPMGGSLWRCEAGSIGELGWEREVPVIARWNEPSPG